MNAQERGSKILAGADVSVSRCTAVLRHPCVEISVFGGNELNGMKKVNGGRKRNNSKRSS